MFALVDDIERYVDFLPWVMRVEVLERSESARIGRLHIARSGLNEQFTTRNTIEPPHRLEMRLLDGPFRVLEGKWTFSTLGEAGRTQGTRVELDLSFEFKSKMMDLLLAAKFASMCDSLVDAFANRARDVYGKS